MDLLGRGIQGLDWKELREQRERRLLNNNWRSELWPTGNFMRLLTAGSVRQLQPCTIWLPAMHCIHPLYIWHPAAHSAIYLCATIQPSSIEVTLEKSVRAALKRNGCIATEQPLLPVSLARLSRQCDFPTRKWLDNRHEEASLMCRESTVLDKEKRQKILRHYEISK